MFDCAHVLTDTHTDDPHGFIVRGGGDTIFNLQTQTSIVFRPLAGHKMPLLRLPFLNSDGADCTTARIMCITQLTVNRSGAKVRGSCYALCYTRSVFDIIYKKKKLVQGPDRRDNASELWLVGVERLKIAVSVSSS